MRPEDVLPDEVDTCEINGLTLRKGTVAAFLWNCRRWLELAPGVPERAGIETEMKAALPALRALGVFDLFDLRDARLRALVGSEPT